MLPTGNKFDSANNCELPITTNTKNMHRNNHQYKIGDKILVKHKKNSKHKFEVMVPFPITQINDNGMVCFQKGIIYDATNIRRIKPFFNKHIKNKKSFHNTIVSLKKNYTKRVFTTQFFSLNKWKCHGSLSTKNHQLCC